MSRRLTAAALLVSLTTMAHAEDAPPAKPPASPAAPAPAAQPAPPSTPEHATDAVLAAVQAKDGAGLKALAAKDDPDPWLVADELIRRGEFEVAEAFAKAAPRVDVEKLPAYVASRRGESDEPARRERLAKANAALQARKPADALAALGAEEPGPIVDVVGVRLAMGRGTALAALKRLDASAAACRAAADGAERLGWLARASRALHESGVSAYGGSAFADAREAWERAVAIHERRGDKAGAAGALGNIGNVHRRLGDYAKALATLERARAALDALGDQAGVARILGNIGNVYDAVGDFAKALASHERAFALKEAVGDHAGAARTLGNIGNVQFELGDYAQALATDERALAALEALGDEEGAARALGNLGNVQAALGDYAKALATYERALAAKEALGDRLGAAETLGNIGNVQYELKDFAKARATHERALSAKEALGDKAGAAKSLVSLGLVDEALGDHARALATYGRALAAKEALGDAAGVGVTLVDIGNVHYALGDFTQALTAYERALAAKEALGDKAGVAATLANMGSVHHALGDYAKALATLERALATQEELRAARGAATTLGNIGSVYYALGDHAKALATFERALAAQEAQGDKAGAAATLAGIGAVHDSLKDFTRALATMKRALAAQEALGDEAGAATTLGNIGNVHLALGDAASALATHERALAAKEALGDKAGAVMSRIGIAVVRFEAGDNERAIEAFERAASAAEQLGATRAVVLSLHGIARARLRAGDAGGAIKSAHRAVSLVKTLVGGLGEEQGANARGQFAELFEIGLSAAAKTDDAREAAFFLESGRAGTLLESLGGRTAIRAAVLPEGLRLAEATARAAEARARVAYTKSLDGDDLTVTRARDAALKAAQATVQEAVERIQRDAKRGARICYPVATSLESLQSSLAPGEALALYGLTAKDDDAHALVVTRDGARIVDLGKSAAIAAACEALDASDRDADPTAALERLRDLLVRPLALSKEAKRLLVSPEGPLSYVPFSALTPDLEVVFEPSGTTYGVLLEERGKRGEQVLALADPDYAVRFNPTAIDLYAPAAVALAGSTRGARLSPLPGTRDEAMAVGDVRLFGKDASEAGLREALAKKKERWHAVHFACHGLVDPDRPTLSSLALTPDAGDDGFLTALEVLRMEIPSDLVVLSACETGKGKIVNGEGIVGLARAFMYAGPPRVICSLWKVDDDATRALMTKFYELWNPKDGKPALPTAEALEKAQEHVRSQPRWKHPYYWAAWVLWGLPS